MRKRGEQDESILPGSDILRRSSVTKSPRVPRGVRLSRKAFAWHTTDQRIEKPQRGTLVQPRATPWVCCREIDEALKGRNTMTIAPFQGLGTNTTSCSQGVAMGCAIVPLQGNPRLQASPSP